MTTKFIGVREFRQNISALYEKANKNNWRFIVLNRNQPIFKVEPLNSKNATLEKIMADIKEAREDIKKGRLYTAKQIRHDLNL